MKQGAFWNSVNKVVLLLNKVGKCELDNLHQTIPYTKSNVEQEVVKTCADIYEDLYENQNFDILTDDYSIFQFSIQNGETRMVFVQNPKKHVSFVDYLAAIGMESEITNWRYLKYQSLEEYNRYRNDQTNIPDPVYLRYETDARGRKNNENIHAYAHLHIGLNNNIRIPVGFDLTPIGFTLFVLRHVYYDKWCEIIRKSLLSNAELEFKSSCGILPPELWTENEKSTLYLT